MAEQPVYAAPPQDAPPNAVAFVIDGVVEDIIYTQDRFFAILTSEPTIVAIKDIGGVIPGQTKWDGTNFIHVDGTVLTPESVVAITPKDGDAPLSAQ
jgi:hypothetical protein